MPSKNRKHDVTKTEPAMVRGAVVAVLSLLAALGFSWAADVDKDTIGAIVAVGVVVVPLIQAWWTRRAVVPAGEVVRGGYITAPPFSGEVRVEIADAENFRRLYGD